MFIWRFCKRSYNVLYGGFGKYLHPFRFRSFTHIVLYMSFKMACLEPVFSTDKYSEVLSAVFRTVTALSGCGLHFSPSGFSHVL